MKPLNFQFIVDFAERLSSAISGIFARSRCVHYINGASTLPPPLSHEKESELIEALSSDHPEDAKNQLIEHNLRLVVYIAKKFESTGTGIEDLISIGTIGLIKAVNTFSADKNIKLATYASRCVENEILMYLRKLSGRREVSIDEPLSVDWDGNELLLSDVLEGDENISERLEKSEDRKTIRAALMELSERERTIITLRFGLNGGVELTQKEVADKLGISQSYISRLEKRILNQLETDLSGKV